MDWRPVLKTAYFTSAVSYLFFLLLEWLRPGFVSYVFSPHLFLAAAILFGVLWGRREQEERGAPMGARAKLFFIFLGLLLAWIVWQEGRALEEFRVLVTLIALLTPSTIYHLLSHHS